MVSSELAPSSKGSDTWEGVLKTFWRLLRSSSLPSGVDSAHANPSDSLYLLKPLEDVDLLHVVAREIRSPAKEVVRIAALVAYTGLTWYPRYHKALQTLAQTFAKVPPAQAPNIAEGVRRLAVARLCRASTAAFVAEVLAGSEFPEKTAGNAVVLLSGFTETGLGMNFMSAMPVLLQGASADNSNDHANDEGLLKDIACLIINGAVDPALPSSEGGLVLSSLWEKVIRLDRETQGTVLRLIRITASHVVTVTKPRPCTEQEIEHILVLSGGLSTSCACSLCELGETGIMRVDWDAILALLVSLQGDRREVALRSAIWLNSESPTWLCWPDVLARVEALDDAGARLEVMEVLADLLRCGKDVEWRAGKDEDFAAGVPPRFDRWVQWLVQVAHSPKWLAIVKKLYGQLLHADPDGQSSLVYRLSCTHRFPCGWTASAGCGCDCYCEFITQHVVPLLGSICGEMSPRLLDTIAGYVRWRRGPQLVRAAWWLQHVASLRLDAKLLGEPRVLSDLLSCHKLFETDASLKLLEGVSLDAAAISAQAVCNPCRGLPTSLTLEVFRHLTSSYAAGANHSRKDACKFAAASAGFLVFMPKPIQQAPWVSTLLHSCCLHWQLHGVEVAQITSLLRKAFQQSIAIRSACRELPPLMSLADLRPDCPKADNNLALLLVAF